eukprot:3977293-Pyramimonas_sp.AAC.1
MVGVVGPLRPSAPWQPPPSRKIILRLAPVVVYMYGPGCCGWMCSTRPAAGGVNMLFSASS